MNGATVFDIELRDVNITRKKGATDDGSPNMIFS